MSEAESIERRHTPEGLLTEIYQRRQVTDAEGRSYKLHSEITPDEGTLISSLIVRHGFTRTLEVGCAYGLSALHICGALAGRSGVHHTMIDPGQNSVWSGVGIHQLRQCGFKDFTLIEEPSEFALPALLKEGRTFQFALIDGWHTFDHTLLDFFFVNRLLEPGGIVAMDDLQLPGIRKVARYIATYPNYKVIGTAKQALFPPSRKRAAVDGIMRAISTALPTSYSHEVFDESFFTSDHDRGLVSEMVAFQKIADDKRDSHWFKPF